MTDIAERVRRAAEDEIEFERLAADFERRNRHLAYKVTGRFITESDEAWLVVLLAFSEAVKTYDPAKGSFAAFSDTVIRRRLIDHIRKEARAAREIPVDLAAAEAGCADSEEEGAGGSGPVSGYATSKAMADRALEEAETEERRSDLRAEIEELTQILKRYDISFTDLADSSPKAKKTKEQCERVIRFLAADDEIVKRIRRTKILPVKEIKKKCGVSRKIPERHRKYIIAVIEILRRDLPGLRQFVKGAAPQPGSGEEKEGKEAGS